jgi:hypothetical protein
MICFIARRSGRVFKNPNVKLSSASTQARVSGESRSSIQRYGSATFVPK